MTSHAFRIVSSPTWGVLQVAPPPGPAVRRPAGSLPRDLAALGLAALVWASALGFLATAVAGPAARLGSPAQAPAAAPAGR